MKNKKGQIFIIVLILLFVVTLLFVSLYSRLGIFIKSSWSTITNDQAIALADGGVDWATRQLTATNGSFSAPPPRPNFNSGNRAG